MDDSIDWRATLAPEDRQEIVKNIMEKLVKYHPSNDEERLLELQKFAQRLEETTYATSTGLYPYLNKISSKMLSMENASDWRTQLLPETRQRIVNKITDTLTKHLPVSGEERLNALREMAQRFEEKNYTVARSQSDYLRKISLKMLLLETKSANSGPSNSAGTSSISPASDASDWRTQLLPETRQRIVNKITDTLTKHLPVSGEERLNALREMAQRFEEKNYAVARSQSDYLRKISLKMLLLETKSANSGPSNSAGTSSISPASGPGLQSSSSA